MFEANSAVKNTEYKNIHLMFAKIQVSFITAVGLFQPNASFRNIRDVWSFKSVGINAKLRNTAWYVRLGIVSASPEWTDVKLLHEILNSGRKL